jgi:hypothetical protein
MAAADGSAANRLAQAGKRIAGRLTIVFLAASGARYVLCGNALAWHGLASAPRPRTGHGTKRLPSASMWRWSAARPV